MRNTRLVAATLIVSSLAAKADALDDNMAICKRHEVPVVSMGRTVLTYGTSFASTCAATEAAIASRNAAAKATSDAADLNSLNAAGAP